MSKIQPLPLLLLIVLVVGVAAQEPIFTGRIEGYVVDAESGSPIFNVRVVLGGGPVREVRTNVDGLFTFDALQPGAYTLRTERAGYIQEFYNGITAIDRIPVSVAAGNYHKLVLRMTRPGVIAGRIYDNERAPVANAQVELLVAAYDGITGNRGLRTLLYGKPVQTDAAGEYSFTGIPPGEYYVRGSYGGASTPSVVTDPMSRTYYPGFVNPDQAVPVHVQPGTEMHAVDFGLSPVLRTRVSGRIVNSLAVGGEREAYSLYLARRNATFTEHPPALPDYDEENDRFELRNIPAGEYELYVVYTPDVRNRNVRPSAGRTVIDVVDRDVTGLTVVIEAGIDIEGHIVLDDTASAMASSLGGPGFRPMLTAIDGMPEILTLNSILQRIPFVEIDGAFRIPAVTRGRYRLMMFLPSQLYVQAARFGPEDILGRTLDVDPHSTEPLIIEVRGDGARLSGSVRDRDGGFVPSARVVLVPDIHLREDQTAYKTAVTGDQGQFIIDGIRPGRYTAVAFEKIQNLQWLNMGFMASHLGQGLALEIRTYEMVDRDLIVTSSLAGERNLAPNTQRRPFFPAP